MPTNEILLFANGVGANVIDQASYSGLPGRSTGFVGGVAQSNQANKAWRQGSFVASTIAQFIADFSGQNVLDDGDVAKLENNMTRALRYQAMNAYVAGGSPNALVITSPIPGAAIAALAFGLPLRVRISANNTGSATLAVDGLPAKAIRRPNGGLMRNKDLISGNIATLVYDLVTDAFVVVSGSENIMMALNLTVDVYDVPSTLVVPTGVNFMYVEEWGGGGGGGAGDGTTNGGLGGAGGAYTSGYHPVTPGSTLIINPGAGGLGNNSPGNAGFLGGTTSLSVSGGATLQTTEGGEGGGGTPTGPASAGGQVGTGYQELIPGFGGFLIYPFGGGGSAGGGSGRGSGYAMAGNGGTRPGGGASGNQVNNAFAGVTISGAAGRVKLSYAG